MTTRRCAIIAAVTALAACGPDRYQVSIARAQLGGERATLRGVLATESGGHGEWIYAGDWTDALTLARDGDRLCVQLAFRDPVTDTLDDFDLELSVDGAAAPTTVETMDVAPIAAIADPERLSTGGAAIRGRLCTLAHRASRVDLHVTHRRLTSRAGSGDARHYQARYRWTLTD
jgi:hypothetical protein